MKKQLFTTCLLVIAHGTLVGAEKPTEQPVSQKMGTASAGARGNLSGRRPNIIIIMADDMGYSDLGCYGSEIQTPNLDQLAAGGLRFTSFYNTGRCCPTRASLLTGLYPHQAGVGGMAGKGKGNAPGYIGRLNNQCVTIAEALKPDGYATMAVGKWHVSHFDYKKNFASHPDTWPLQRGFDRFYGTVSGGGSYYNPLGLFRGNKQITVDTDPEYPARDFYYTDAISDQASRFLRDHAKKHDPDSDNPFFMYVAYTAPHWPLHAREEDIAKYRKLYQDNGWDKLREQRYRQLIKKLGLVDRDCKLSARDAQIPAWNDAKEKEWEAERMAVYAAQIDRMDQGIGKITGALKQTGQIDDTIIIFLADNGGCDEKLAEWTKNLGIVSGRKGETVEFGNIRSPKPGPSNTFASYGRRWANLSNVPFRRYKSWIHEGGIATPLIVCWPNGIDENKQGKLRGQVTHTIDLMATCVDLSGGAYPKKRKNQNVTPAEGVSLLPVLNDNKSIDRKQLAWEHFGARGIRQGRWKLVSISKGEWELYDMQSDRTELNNLAGNHPGLVEKMKSDWQIWADRVGVFPK
jgi:arylsulfatase A-like enzyme